MNSLIENLQNMLNMEKDYAKYHMDFESWARYRLVRDMIRIVKGE